jgi:hypothetical protein
MVPRIAGRPESPDGPCDPRAPIQTPKPLGAGTGCPLYALEVPRPPLGRFDDPPERWPSCREAEGGLSSNDERVRGPVTEVKQALRKSSKWSPRRPHVYRALTIMHHGFSKSSYGSARHQKRL